MEVKTNKNNIFQKGFTLLELLLVITLISILITIGVTSFNTSGRFADARNDTRKRHIQTIENAITQYKLQTGNYPTGLSRTYQEICDPDASSCSGFLDLKTLLVPNYLQAIPQDPNDKDSTGGAGYSIAVDTATNTVSVRSLGSESDVTISVNDPLPAEQTVVTNSTLAATVPGTPPSSVVNFNITDSGLYGQRFVGYYADSVSFFNTASKHGDTSLTSQINSFSSSADNYSWQWVGYFKAPTTGSYTFFTSSDDASHLWIGSNAVSGFTTANATVNNGGLHATIETSRTVSLTAGQYYPIRIMFGESGGGDIMTVSFSGPSIAKTTDGTGYFFGGQYFWDTYIGDINGNINNMVTNGLVLYLDAGITASYPGTGTTWFDLSGNNNNGTLTGGITYSSNNGGYLTVPNGVQYVSVAQNSSLLEYPGDFSMESWFMLTSQPSSIYPSAIFSVWGGTASSTNSSFIVYVTSSYQLVGEIKGQNTGISHQSAISLNTWYHVVLVRSGGVFRIYLNGLSSTQTGISNTNLTSVLDTLVGYYAQAAGNSIKGRVSLYRVYKDKGLTESEVLQNFNATKTRFGL